MCSNAFLIWTKDLSSLLSIGSALSSSKHTLLSPRVPRSVRAPTCETLSRPRQVGRANLKLVAYGGDTCSSKLSAHPTSELSKLLSLTTPREVNPTPSAEVWRKWSSALTSDVGIQPIKNQFDRRRSLANQHWFRPRHFAWPINTFCCTSIDISLVPTSSTWPINNISLKMTSCEKKW